MSTITRQEKKKKIQIIEPIILWNDLPDDIQIFIFNLFYHDLAGICCTWDDDPCEKRYVKENTRFVTLIFNVMGEISLVCKAWRQHVWKNTPYPIEKDHFIGCNRKKHFHNNILCIKPCKVCERISIRKRKLVHICECCHFKTKVILNNHNDKPI